jgi:hypothetical protein
MAESTERVVSVADEILERIPVSGEADRDLIISLIKRACESSGNLEDHDTPIAPRVDGDERLAGLTHREIMLIEEAFLVGVATTWRLMTAVTGGAR